MPSFANSRGIGYQEIGAFVAAVRRTVAPKRDGRKAVIYPFSAVDFIGHTWFDPHILRTLFPAETHQVFFIRPPLPADADTAHAAIATRGLEVVDTLPLPPALIFSLAATIFHDQAAYDFGDLHVVFGGASRSAREIYHLRRRGQPQRATVSLTDVERAEGRAVAEGLGMDVERPLVVLHAREAGYNAAHHFNRFRDCDIATYRPAVEALARRGFSVLRIGDPSMQPLGVAHPHVHDAAHVGRMMLDLWALERCAFMIHCAAGPADIARAFGRPWLCINGYMGDYAEFESPHVILPKRIEETASGRAIDYAEMFRLGLPALWHADQLDRLGLRMVGAEPEAIEAACLAFVDAFGRPPAPPGRFESMNQGEAARRAAAGGRWPEQRFWAMDLPHSVLADAFLDRHPDFLDRDLPELAERAALPDPQ